MEMGMKKFLIRYVIFVFVAVVLLLVFLVLTRVSASTDKIEERKEKIIYIGSRNNIPVIVEKLIPKGRLLVFEINGVLFGDWMSIEDAIVEKLKMINYFNVREKNIHIQYDKWPY